MTPGNEIERAVAEADHETRIRNWAERALAERRERSAAEQEGRMREIERAIRNDRIAEAQAALKNELRDKLEERRRARQPAQRSGLPLGPLAQGECYRIFRETVEREAKLRAPEASTLVDVLQEGEGLVELSCRGVTVKGTVGAALSDPKPRAQSLVYELVNRLQKELGARETGAETGMEIPW